MTEPLRLEETPPPAEANYRALIHGAPYGVFRARFDGRLLEVNPALTRMLGYDSPSDLLGVNFVTDLFREPREPVQVIERLKLASQPNGIEVEWKRKDGTPIAVRLSGRLIRHPGGHLVGLEAFAEDVTERRRVEEQLRQTHRIEVVERLAGGVAHEFNNLLMIISGRGELLHNRLSANDPALRDLAIIQDTVRRAAALIQQLLAFGRRQVFDPRAVALDDVIADLAPMLRALMGEDVELLIVPGSRHSQIQGDPPLLQQVLMNLALNAREAMPHGGRLTIQTANIEIDETVVSRYPGICPGPHVVLAVSDTGIGMDARTRARIFEPFFTTKEVGEGPGLGLSAVYGMVKQHQGGIVVDSAPSQGSTFKIYLPRVEEVAPAVESEPPLTPPPLSSETVLLVEDEAGVRAVTRESLRVHGYSVLEAADAREAIRICEQHEGPIDLLLTDVVMPGLSGPELAHRLAALRPAMKVLYMSGYDERTLAQHGVGSGTALLHKPFTTATLGHKVRELLDRQETI